MPVRRTDLQDELAALIAAGRELPPDHDRVLAEVFLDRLAERIAPPSRTRRAFAVMGKPRHLLGAVILGLAVLGVASVQSIHHASGSNVVVQPLSVKRVPSGLGKVPVAPLAPKVPVAVPPKVAVPLPPNAPVAPQAPAPKGSS